MRNFIMSACTQRFDELQKRNFSLAKNDIIDVMEMGQQVIPQKGGPDAAKNNFNARVQVFGDFRDIDGTPSIGVEDGEADDVRAFFLDNVRNDVGSMICIVPVVNVDIEAIFFQQCSHVIDTDGGNTDVVLMDSLVEKVGVNQ